MKNKTENRYCNENFIVAAQWENVEGKDIKGLPPSRIILMFDNNLDCGVIRYYYPALEKYNSSALRAFILMVTTIKDFNARHANSGRSNFRKMISQIYDYHRAMCFFRGYITKVKKRIDYGPFYKDLV